uniref:ORF3 protein n=1 Tax=Miniopterus bat coronavirus/Kenya/KY33/2006 TaxID=983928 RepID=F1DB15_9ALPC|nr:ORF3 protein [Miniopterus bat coronavirus/Kenya/KY33/2006]
MFGGLFQLSFDTAINNTVKRLRLTPEQASVVNTELAPVHHATSALGYLLTSVFVVYFAIYKASTLRGNVMCLLARVVLIFVYSPLLLYCGSFVDGSFIAGVLIARFCQTCYYAYRYKNLAFVIYNTTVLAFINGKPWYYHQQPWLVLSGGDHYVTLGVHIIPFVSNNELYVAVRGSTDENLDLVRCVELIDGSFFYIFCKEPVVGVVNFKFSEIKLYEDVDIN